MTIFLVGIQSDIRLGKSSPGDLSLLTPKSDPTADFLRVDRVSVLSGYARIHRLILFFFVESCCVCAFRPDGFPFQCKRDKADLTSQIIPRLAWTSSLCLCLVNQSSGCQTTQFCLTRWLDGLLRQLADLPFPYRFARQTRRRRRRSLIPDIHRKKISELVLRRTRCS